MKPVAACALALAVLAGAGCQGPTGAVDRGAPAGCGLVEQRAVTGLLGEDVTVAALGNLRRLRGHGEPVVCTTTVTGSTDRYIRIHARHHPDPMDLPDHDCDAGRVVAGTPQEYAPACQQAVGSGGRTVLFDRHGEYVVRVTIGRADQNWGGDAEAALRLSRQLGARLTSS